MQFYVDIVDLSLFLLFGKFIEYCILGQKKKKKKKKLFIFFKEDSIYRKKNYFDNFEWCIIWGLMKSGISSENFIK